MKTNKIILKVRNFTLNKNLLILCALFFLTSCLGIKHQGVKSDRKLYETFYAGEEGTQYFIKPLLFSSQLNNELLLDITFRRKNEIKDSAIINISFFSKEMFKVVDSLKINNEDIAIILNQMKHMFTERHKEVYNCRFSVNVNLIDVKKLFHCNNWDLLLYKNGISTNYMTPKTTKRKIDKLEYEIFSLF